MSSINEQQQEKNHEDLHGISAVNKIKELAEKNKTCFFCTSLGNDHSFQTRPMSVQKVDDEGCIWFLSASDSSLNKEIEMDNKVQLLFQGSAHSDFMNLVGVAGISRNKEMIDALWEPIYKTWFTEGKDDPRITVIMFKPKEGYYWDNKHGNAVAFVKMTIGAITGKTMDDSIEGKLVV
ncbi:MAG: pyridoxamine 5'-phosphate oxidase family protein [Ferruginibacter sp.]